MKIINENAYNILVALYQEDKGFNRLLKELDMNPKTLSSYLKELDGAWLINRIVFKKAPIRVEYRLSTDGMKLCEMLMDIEKLLR
jgi:DNA-binding HxlR family transcriptional regulator